jgi:hypothetical protein
LELIAAGKSYDEIANGLGRSVGSIATVVFRQRRLHFSKKLLCKNIWLYFDEIANELKKSPGSISDFLKREKVIIPLGLSSKFFDAGSISRSHCR